MFVCFQPLAAIEPERDFSGHWILDPASRKAYRSTPGALTEISELRAEDPEIVVPLQALFE